MPDDASEAHFEGGNDGCGGLVGRIELVPLFPLPNVVLLPGAVLPLHVFERRYRQMTRHTVDADYDGRRLIGMCRVKGDFDPMDDTPPLYEVGCIAAVVDHQTLPDGRYNVLVKGVDRARLGGEAQHGLDAPDGEPYMYRRADMHVIPCQKAFEIDLGEARQKMKLLCRRPPILGTPVATQLEKLFLSNVPTARLADVLAFDLLEDVEDKQRLLEETDVRRRVEVLAALLDKQFPEADSIVKLSERFQVDD